MPRMIRLLMCTFLTASISLASAQEIGPVNESSSPPSEPFRYSAESEKGALERINRERAFETQKQEARSAYLACLSTNKNTRRSESASCRTEEQALESFLPADIASGLIACVKAQAKPDDSDAGTISGILPS